MLHAMLLLLLLLLLSITPADSRLFCPCTVHTPPEPGNREWMDDEWMLENTVDGGAEAEAEA